MVSGSERSADPFGPSDLGCRANAALSAISDRSCTLPAWWHRAGDKSAQQGLTRPLSCITATEKLVSFSVQAPTLPSSADRQGQSVRERFEIAVIG